MTDTSNLKRIRMTPEDKDQWLKMRAEDLTSTEVSALFDCSPYATRFALWHRKSKQDIGEIEVNDRMKWGTRLEDTIARGVAEDEGFETRKFNQYIRLTDYRLGASFDYEIINHPDGPGILEVKNVDSLVFRDGWIVGEDGDVEAPPHIELQLQQQLLVSGRSWGMIAALVGGNRVVLVIRQYDPEIGARIIEEASAFWKSIDANTPPAPDYARDAQIICQIYNHAEPGKIFDASSDEIIPSLLLQYKMAGDDIKVLEGVRDEVKARILELVGDAEKVITPVGNVSAGIVGECPVSYVRSSYRNFRFNLKKGVELPTDRPWWDGSRAAG